VAVKSNAVVEELVDYSKKKKKSERKKIVEEGGTANKGERN